MRKIDISRMKLIEYSKLQMGKRILSPLFSYCIIKSAHIKRSLNRVTIILYSKEEEFTKRYK
jgi:hypothetical protein